MGNQYERSWFWQGFGVNLYATNVLNHYFPGDSETGLGRSDWNSAHYESENLPDEDRYFYESTQ